MKIKRPKTIITILLIIILVAWWYHSNQKKQLAMQMEHEQNMMHTVKKDDIQVSVKVTANAKLADEQKLSFGREGKITHVNVNIGDEVKADDILAQLNMDEYQNAIQTSQLELANAKLWLEKMINEDNSVREAQLHSQINEAKANHKLEIEQEQILNKQLKTSLQQREEQLTQLNRDYELAQKDLQIAASGLDINVQIETEQTENTLIAHNQTINSTLTALTPILGDAEFVIESVDKIFAITEPFKHNDLAYDHLLGGKATPLKNETKTNILNSYDFIDNYQEKIADLNSNSSDNEIYTFLQEFHHDSEVLIKLCDTALDSIEMSVESVDLSAETIAWFTSTVSTARSAALGIRWQLENLATNINALLSNNSQKEQLQLSTEQKQLEYDRQKILLQKQGEDIQLLVTEIDNLKKDNNNQLNRKSSQIKTIADNINVLEKELVDLLDWPDDYDIKQQKNLIQQAQLRLERTKDQEEDYQIIAEFDGRVRTIDIVEGEQYKLDDNNFIVVENPNLIELELEVSQIDIVKIKEGDPVVITFDAYPNKPIKASISSRNVNPETNTRGGTYYKATILLTKQELEILAGMSALVTIVTAEATDVISIPTLSLIQKDNKKFVYLKEKESDEYSLHEIQTGIMNNFQVEVTQWLEKGNIIKASVLDDKALSDMGIDDSSGSIFGD